MYVLRAVDKAGNTPDFILSERRNCPAATGFLVKSLSSNGIPDKILSDKSGVNAASIREAN
ncbi:DDE-type integrase/transposase/recombinase [Ruegeria atlantica]|uniref:DDE-type integrase/transposase/recombinase n=1 Tax=Ruegeria atlantica TaxID=81569 RepID=UPI003D7D3ABA